MNDITDVPDFKDWLAERLIGLNFNDCLEYLSMDGWVLRAIKKDGVPAIVTRDVRLNRINVEVENGDITKVVNIG